MIKKIIVSIFIISSSQQVFSEENATKYVDSFCKTYYKDSDRVKDAQYWTTAQSDYSAICYIRKGFDAEYTLLVKNNNKGWNIRSQRGGDDDLVWLRKTLIGYRYNQGQWSETGLPVSDECKDVSNDIAIREGLLVVNKYLYDDYGVLQEGNSSKFVKGNYTCITEYKKPSLSGGDTYLTLVIEYNPTNGVYEYERDKRYESGGTAYPFEREIKAIVNNRKSQKLY